MRLRRRSPELWPYDSLARYNAERARGICHTPEWEAKMAHLQVQFDADQRRTLEREGIRMGEGPSDRERQYWQSLASAFRA